jgi:Excalibur calcium-binding domain
MRRLGLMAATLVLFVGVALAASASAQGGDRDCADFSTQSEAQAFFEGPGSDPHGLDGDADGLACESLRCPCGEGAGGDPPVPGPEPPPDPAPAPPSGPKRTVERASTASVVAELSYVKRRRSSGGLTSFDYRDLRVRIHRGGLVVRDERVPRRCAHGCIPAALWSDKAIRLRDLDADGEPEVVVDLFTGGANCCLYTLVYGFAADEGSYVRAVKNFGSFYRPRDYDGDGTVEFLAGDYRFKYVFSCGACSTQPLTIWQWEDLALSDASRRFPAALHRDARRMYRLYRRARPDPALVKGILPAYVANLCRIGRCRRALRVVNHARRLGELDRRGRYDQPPFGRAYVRALKRFLRRTGYIR